MSRIGKKPVALPKGVTASVEGQTVKVKGPKGELSVKLVSEVSAKRGRDAASPSPPTRTQERGPADVGPVAHAWSTIWSPG